MSRKYYCLIAGLPDVLPEDTKTDYSVNSFREYLVDELHPDDLKLTGLLYLTYDNQNLINLLNETGKEFLSKGNFSRELLEDQIKLIKNGEIQPGEGPLPSYMISFLDSFFSESEIFPELSKENQLTRLYYEHALDTKNDFLRNYFEFELNLNNVLAAYNSRKHDLDPGEEILQINEVAALLIKTSRDSTLGNDYPYLQELQQILEDSDLFEREKKIDNLKWKYLDDQVFFHYFTIERVISYSIKLELLERWMQLDRETGEKMFKQLIRDLEESYEFPEEYTLN
ncbi:MAG TPA: DUF2764 family protein [Bacteroidales bacterium]|nr:DUF2764 family protein [Bacteroidales bacterium]